MNININMREINNNDVKTFHMVQTMIIKIMYSIFSCVFLLFVFKVL